MAIAGGTFREAGWETTDPKAQCGFRIESLGLEVVGSAEDAPAGAFRCTEVRRQRQALIRDIEAQLTETRPASRAPGWRS
eukprot:scaffold8120_cov37-Tisochrysis_lutea.AAC.1